MRAALLLLTLSAALPALAQPGPPGEPKTARTRALEAGARLLQSGAPLAGFDIYLVGFHPMKDQPGQQMEAHHFCRQVNQDFAQCVLFDGGGAQARLTGVEYIISAPLFGTLPAAEQAYWHPHNGEILSGQLAAPGLPAAAEHALMRDKLNSYGKTWHLWPAPGADTPGAALPLGPAMLAWSFNRDGELDPGLLTARDRRLGLDSATRRRQREDLRALAAPQVGVDALKGRFGRDTRALPGVTERGAGR